jgi:hypothetical protein
VLELADDTDQQVVTWMAADDVTAGRLESLVGPPRLRLVRG